MKAVRSHIISKYLAIITGVTFLNMGFFLFEIKLLDLHLTNYELVENIVKMISCVGFEEERDPGGESSEGSSSKTIPDFYLLSHLHDFNSHFLLRGNPQVSAHCCPPARGQYDVITPPPKKS